MMSLGSVEQLARAVTRAIDGAEALRLLVGAPQQQRQATQEEYELFSLLL